MLEDVLAEEEGGRFALTELGHCLRADAAGSMRDPILARGEVYHQAAAGTLAAVRHGGTAFEQVHGDRFFDHLRRHPEQEAAFQASMAGRSEQEAVDVVAAYDFGGIGRLVDVGGGHGILLGAILRSAPDLRAVLVGGDFFAGVPAGADACLLSRVLHDWSDDDARRVLATCRAAMGPGSRLLVVEAILPERAADQPAVIRMDLYMLVLLGAPRAHRGPVPAGSWPAPGSRSAGWSRPVPRPA